MATVSYVETVLVENSDDRLAAVEEAKRTGQPFQSVAANKSEVVPYDVAAQIAEDKAHENTYVGRFGATYAAHLEGYHEAVKDPDFVTQTNEEKAQAHHDYSAEFARKREEEDAEVRKKIKEGYDVSLAVQQANLDRAREHQGVSADYEKVRQERVEEEKPVLQMIDEAVKIVNTEDLVGKPLEERAAALAGVATVPEALEKTAQDALIVKDQIIATEEPYKDHAQSFDNLKKRDHPGVEVLESVGSPKELEEITVEARIAANNLVEAPSAAVDQQEDAPKSKKGRKTEEVKPTAEPVPDANADDELRENPSE